MDDMISRQAAIDIERNATVDTNPSHFEAHQKFMQFMDDAEISSFGRWQWSNGFNTALTAVGIDLKKLPSAQPEPCEDAVSRQAVLDTINNPLNVRLDVIIKNLPSVTPKPRKGKWLINSDGYYPFCSECNAEPKSGEMTNFCPKCGAKMEGERWIN